MFDERLVSRLDLLGDPDENVVTTPPVFVAFDLLTVRGQDLRLEPLRVRREALEHEVSGSNVLLGTVDRDDVRTPQPLGSKRRTASREPSSWGSSTAGTFP